MQVKHIAAGLAVSAVIAAGAVTACSDNHYDHCRDDGVVCDDRGAELIYAPYIVPAYGVFGTPGYHSSTTIYPGAPGYRTTYVNHPPDYKPTRTPSPPAPNTKNTKPATTVKATTPKPSSKPSSGSTQKTNKPSAPTVKAPSVKAPSVKAPSVRSSK